jgi:hypothetical protein
MLQRAPMRQSRITWLKCQIFVPAPISDGWSIAAVSWAK